MGWIKRNLTFVIGGAVALALLGAGSFYIFKGWSSNSAASDKLNEIYGTLKTLQTQSPSPGNEKINNTSIAKEQQRQVQGWIDTAGKYFQPVPPIPAGTVTSEAFASALRRTVEQLQRQAGSCGVTLPPKYDFSFAAQRPLVKFAPGSLNPLAVQLGEVKALADAVFSAKINALDSIQRMRVSEDDATGPAGDYTDVPAVTNDLAVLTPYVVTFRSFSPELARVLAALAGNSNAFLIKAVNVQPAGMAVATGTPGGMPGMMPGTPPAMMPGEFGAMQQPVPTPAYGQPTTPKGGMPTILKEQLLRVTLEVYFVKLQPKS